MQVQIFQMRVQAIRVSIIPSFRNFSFIILIIFGLAYNASVKCEQSEAHYQDKSMTKIKPQVTLLLNKFRTNSEVESLSESIQLVNNTKVEDTASFTDKKYFRTEKLSLYLMILNEMDAKILPDFDFNDVPFLTVSPPAESGVPADVDPESIDDPMMKKEYKKNIKENQIKSAQYSLQKKLHKINQITTEQVESYIQANFSNEGNEVIELNQLIDDNIKSDKRRASLKKIVLKL